MTDSHWGDLDEDRIARIKADLAEIVEHAVESAMSKSLDAQRDTIAQGVAQGLASVVADEKLFGQIGDRVAATLRKAARNSAGDFVLSGGARLAKVIGWLLLAMLAVWSLFGWSGVVAAWKYITTSHAAP